ncbi:MAG: guanylate kinase [Candidatus Omnitrophota bacterium]
MDNKGKLLVVSAPSGAGKTTLCDKLISIMPDVVCSISTTTRAPRGGEKNKCDYIFVSESKFEEMIKNNQFLEYAKVFGNYYGTPRKFVEDNLARGRDVLLNIDVQGAMKVRKKFRKDSIFIFILPPSMKDLEKRLLRRKTDSRPQIKKRLEVAKKELTYLKFYDYQIINDKIKYAFEKLKSIVIAARCRLN